MVTISLCPWWAKGKLDGHSFTERSISEEAFYAILALYKKHPDYFDYENTKCDLTQVDYDECHHLYDELMEEYMHALYSDNGFMRFFDADEFENFLEEFKRCGFKTGIDISGCLMDIEPDNVWYRVMYDIDDEKVTTKIRVETTVDEIFDLFVCDRNNTKITDCQKLDSLVSRIEDAIINNKNVFINKSNLHTSILDIEHLIDFEALNNEPDVSLDSNCHYFGYSDDYDDD